MTSRIPQTLPARAILVLTLCFSLLFAFGMFTARAGAQGVEGEATATWRLEQPSPPPRVPGEPSLTPIGLGRIGDIEFWAPNRGLLITAGNPPTIPPGLWAYNGVSWHELATVCGATDGRLAWAGPEEFWTISDGRPGQSANKLGELPPLEDDTLCHFSGGQVVGSYASPAFEANSYLPMNAAGCIGPSDCWFAGDALGEPLPVGAFQLHWNGGALSAEPYLEAGHAVQDMRLFEGSLYESVRLSPADRLLQPNPEAQQPFPLHIINPEGIMPTFEAEGGLPLYGHGEFSTALDFLHLAAGEGALWGAAGPQPETPEGSAPAEVTIVRYTAESGWSQVLGPDTPGEDPFPKDVVNGIAAEPGTDSVWLALDSQADAERPSPTAKALVAHVSAGGVVSETEELPSAQEQSEGVGPKGAAAEIACPAPNECWLATTQGWLFHLSSPGSSTPGGVDADPAFTGLITYRPPDQGLPQVVPDAPPSDDSGLGEEAPDYGGTFAETKVPAVESKIQAPLLTDVHSRLVHGSTLELRFHLAVKARVRLLAERHKKVVASTPMRTLAAGNRKLLLTLNRHDWPTKLSLQTHPLAPLPTTT
ncbi:MAG: hypothetical protein WCC27_15720, partial [Acidobacteriaceae bacterium]